jgi:tRNA dimethylallyltransferase
MSNKLLVVIGGPTSVGKTDLAIQLALHYRTEIICADSRQVYKELEIGVGRPSPDQLGAVPHHMIGITSISDHYTVAHFEKDALNTLDSLFKHHNILFLTGGTGLYVKALLEGFDDIPEVPEHINDRWTLCWKEKGILALQDALQKSDPTYMTIVDKENPMRLIRALAVCEATGKPFSSFLKGEKTIRPFTILPIVLELPRPVLYQKINERVEAMIGMGWIEEARALLPQRQLKALQTIGYNELFEYLDGSITLPEAIQAIQQSTRRYAKRQMTWWRHQGNWHTFHPENAGAIIDFIDAAKPS